jgi:hypothetical protein
LQDKYTDCSFKINDDIIKCHKLILSAASPVFEAMFYGQLAETKSVKITDIKSDVFENMLNFIYSGKCDLDINAVDKIFDLYCCAQKYIIDDLCKICLNFIATNIRTDNLLKIVYKAWLLNIEGEDILLTCLYILRDWLSNGMSFGNYILDTDIRMPSECVNVIFDNCLDNESEENLLNAACLLRAWCMRECDKNKVEMCDKNIQMLLSGFNLSSNFQYYVRDKLCIIPQRLLSCYDWTICQRAYYRAVKPLIVAEEMEFNSQLTTSRFIVLKSFYINSRLVSPDTSSRSPISNTYTENILVEILNEDTLIYSNKHTIYSVEYNSNMEIVLINNIILFPNINYNIRIRWNWEDFGIQYPRSILASNAKFRKTNIAFDETMFASKQLPGSILNGLVCALYN